MTSYDTNPGPFGEPDDDPPVRTIPEKVEPGRRFMEADTPHRWSVYDWSASACHCIYMVTGEYDVPVASQFCPDCKGMGEGPLEPELVACDLCESDARILAFGPDLLAACEPATRILAYVLDVTGKVKPLEIKARLEQAMAKVKGV